jgi:myo-inositol-1(or 4)-monophosphatase
MTQNQLKMALSQIESLAREAGSLCLAIQQNLGKVQYKSPKDVVTEADLASDRLISDRLREWFPDHGLRTEETGEQGTASEFVWIVDPIDGTVNFSRGMPMWGISIALVHRNEPVLAVCYLPRIDEMFTAIQGEGAHCNGKRIQVSTTTDLSKAVVSNGDFNVGPVADIPELNARNIRIFTAQAKHLQRVKCVGSAVVEGAFTAAGRLDLYSMTMSYPWDIAGVTLLVREAGGTVTMIDGSPLRIEDGAQVLFSNGILHKPYLQAVNAGTASP